MKRWVIAAFAVVVLAGVEGVQAEPVQPTPAAGGPLSYYIMVGIQVLAGPYSTPAACTKALVKLQRSMPGGGPTLVCALRRP